MSNLFALLAEETGSNSNTLWIMLGMVALFAVLFIVMIIPQRRNRKKMVDTLSKLSEGDKITTAGGIIGTIVEVDEENQTFVIATGSEENPTLIRIVKNAIYAFNSVAKIEEEERARIEEEERARLEKEQRAIEKQAEDEETDNPNE